jgi:hypothetical protein
MGWLKSRFCDTGACVEVATPESGTVLIRDSKDPDSPMLRFTEHDWDAILDGIKAGRLSSLSEE